MEENMNTELMEVEETSLAITEDEDNSENAGAVLVIAGIATAGALIGIGAMKLGSKVKEKLQKYREKKAKEKNETTDTAEVVNAEFTEKVEA